MDEQQREIDIRGHFPECPKIEETFDEQVKWLNGKECYIHGTKKTPLVDEKTGETLGVIAEEYWSWGTKDGIEENLELRRQMLEKERNELAKKKDKIKDLTEPTPEQIKEMERISELNNLMKAENIRKQTLEQMKNHERQIENHEKFLKQRETLIAGKSMEGETPPVPESVPEDE